MTTPSPEQAATIARHELGVGVTGPLPDILSLIENVAQVPVALLDLPRDISGAFGRHPERSFIFINSAHAPVRRRFTLGHEFGHYRLGHQGAIDPKSNLDVPRSRTEIDANAFSASFLLPVEAVEAWMKSLGVRDVDLEVVVRLAAHFRVSANVARFRMGAARYLKPRGAKAGQLDQLISDGRHLELGRELGIEEAPDSLSLASIGTGLVRFPREMVANALRGIAIKAVHPARAAAVLHRSEAEILAALEPQSSAEVEDESANPLLRPLAVRAWG